MSDRLKTIFAVICFLSALILPLINLVIGWWRWDAKIGLILMMVGFFIPLIAGGWALYRVQDLSWLTVGLPYVFGGLYTVLPDAIPLLPVDDAAATTAGALLSYALALRKQPDTPKWIFLPLLAAGVYAFFGGTIPGPIDEALVDVVAFAIAWIGVWRGRKSTIDVDGSLTEIIE
ncbi:MAG: hypothetical protein IMY76_05405 [Chloroflexi bacterium]|nr:hypothetical protein [Chloroflexota bacterium]